MEGSSDHSAKSLQVHTAPIGKGFRSAFVERARHVFQTTISEMEQDYKGRISRLESSNQILKNRLDEAEENLGKTLKELDFRQEEIKMLRNHQKIQGELREPMSTANKMHSMELSSILERSTSDAMHDQSRQIEELRAKVRQLESTIVNLEQMDLLKLNKFIAEFTRKAQNQNRFTEKPSNPIAGAFSCLLIRKDEKLENYRKIVKEDVQKFMQSQAYDIKYILLSNTSFS